MRHRGGQINVNPGHVNPGPVSLGSVHQPAETRSIEAAVLAVMETPGVCDLCFADECCSQVWRGHNAAD
jgi:hypothetical protein